MAWWREARFGMFIHWGLYSVPAGIYKGKKIQHIGEWIMNEAKIPVAEYPSTPKQFDPEISTRTNGCDGEERGDEIHRHHRRSTTMVLRCFIRGQSVQHLRRDALSSRSAEGTCRGVQKHGIKLGFYYSQAQDWTTRRGRGDRGHWDKAQDGEF